MSLTPCPDCFSRRSAFNERGDGKCRHHRGKGIDLGLISGLFHAPGDALVATTSICWACDGTGQCQTCGGRGEISE